MPRYLSINYQIICCSRDIKYAKSLFCSRRFWLDIKRCKVPKKRHFVHLIVELAVLVKWGICEKGLSLYKKECAKSVIRHFFTLFKDGWQLKSKMWSVHHPKNVYSLFTQFSSIYTNFCEQKKVLTSEKSSFPKIGFGHQHGRRFVVLGHQYGGRDFK